MTRTRSGTTTLVGWIAAASVLALPGCESRRDAELRAAEAEREARGTPVRGNRPEALMVRFVASRGTGFTREAWEIEILQLGGDVRLRGSLRAAADVVPVFGTLSEAEYAELWQWLAGLPLDQYRVLEDSTATGDGWTRRLEVDIVLGPERRILSRNAWTRPALGVPWLSELEGALHALAVEHAVSAPVENGPVAPDSTQEAVAKAVREALNELEGTGSRDGAATP